MNGTRRSTLTAFAIVAAAGLGAFVVATVAVSSAESDAPPAATQARYPFSSLNLTGGVRAPVDGSNDFALDFVTTFTLAPDSPGVAEPVVTELQTQKPTPGFGDVTIENQVSYPVAAGNSERAVGPVGLPFATETLALTVRLRGHCFVPSTADGATSYALAGDPSTCAAATLALGDSSWDVSSLFRAVSGEFTQTGDRTWTGIISATFTNPGYAFPVSSLGGNGGTSLSLGQNGGVATTSAAAFGGGPDLVGPPTNAAQCRGSGWMTFNNPTFKNQGDCVSYVATGGRNAAAG